MGKARWSSSEKKAMCATGASFILHFVMPDITSLPLRRRLVVHQPSET